MYDELLANLDPIKLDLRDIVGEMEGLDALLVSVKNGAQSLVTKQQPVVAKLSQIVQDLEGCKVAINEEVRNKLLTWPVPSLIPLLDVDAVQTDGALCHVLQTRITGWLEGLLAAELEADELPENIALLLSLLDTDQQEQFRDAYMAHRSRAIRSAVGQALDHGEPANCILPIKAFLGQRRVSDLLALFRQLFVHEHRLQNVFRLSATDTLFDQALVVLDEVVESVWDPNDFSEMVRVLVALAYYETLFSSLVASERYRKLAARWEDRVLALVEHLSVESLHALDALPIVSDAFTVRLVEKAMPIVDSASEKDRVDLLLHLTMAIFPENPVLSQKLDAAIDALATKMARDVFGDETDPDRAVHRFHAKIKNISHTLDFSHIGDSRTRTMLSSLTVRHLVAFYEDAAKRTAMADLYVREDLLSLLNCL